jgi:hypothetical protein
VEWNAAVLASSRQSFATRSTRSYLDQRILAGAEDAWLVERPGSVGDVSELLFLGESEALTHAVRAVVVGAATLIAGALVIGQPTKNDGTADAYDSDVSLEETFELVTQTDVRSGNSLAGT